MDVVLKKTINKYIEDEHLVNRLVVTAFVEANEITVLNNQLINSLLLPKSDSSYVEISSLFNSFSFENLIEAFEVAIPSKDKQTNGAVYTPMHIKKFIISRSIKDLDKPLEEALGADISCGCGAFLYSLAVTIHNATGKSIVNILEDQLFGLDINHSSILRAKIILTLLALSEGEDKTEISFNLFTGDALDFNCRSINKVNINGGFDLIVGNPPYVRAKHISESSKSLLKKWEVTNTGNPDLYIPFFEIGLKNLNLKGILGYITVNTFYKSVNARSLRTYLAKHQVKIKIIDFGHEQVFSKKLAYTCICFLNITVSPYIYFTKSSLKALSNVQDDHYTQIPYSSLNSHRGWLLSNLKTIANIQKIEGCGSSLGKLFLIKNGIATLSNDIYIFKPIDEDNLHYLFIKNGKEYKIEKGICRDIIKPNILKYEYEISKVKEKLIYPYINGITPLSIIKETDFQKTYPYAYQYLCGYREKLSERDKGCGDYGTWYAFGRTQALADKGLRLLFPYMAKKPYFIFTDDENMLIYCGYAIFSDSISELLVLKKLLESDIFDYYMKNTSKPYASEYFSYAKNYVKNFGVCELSESEKEEVIKLKTDREINAFFMNKYKLEL